MLIFAWIENRKVEIKADILIKNNRVDFFYSHKVKVLLLNFKK
jgi:hypothetical protein